MIDLLAKALSRSAAEVVANAADEKPLNPFPHGPQRFRTVSNGQIRRLQTRRAAAARRKTNRRYRREWMRNERAFNTLRQQLVVATAPIGEFPNDLMLNAHFQLEQVYGSVAKAQDYFGALALERKHAA